VSLPDADAPGLLVKTDVARRQIDAESAKPETSGTITGAGTGDLGGGIPGEGTPPDGGTSTPSRATQPKRFHGSVQLDAARVGRDASRIADEVIAHLAGLVGSKVSVTLEIDAEIPSGAPDHVVRTVTENGRTLKFTSQGFEKE